MTDESPKKTKKKASRKKATKKKAAKTAAAAADGAAEEPKEEAVGMDKYAVEEREEDLGGGMTLVKRADGSGMVKAGSVKYEIDSIEQGGIDEGGLPMAKFAEAPPEKVKGQLLSRGYGVK